MNKKFVYQVGNNKNVILWCTANQISIHKYFYSQYIYLEKSQLMYSSTSPVICEIFCASYLQKIKNKKCYILKVFLKEFL